MGLTIAQINTATSPVTGARSITPDPINFAADFRTLRESANEIVLTSLNAPVSAPETIRIAFTEIADVFKGTGLEPTADTANTNGSNAARRGCSVLIQISGSGLGDDAVSRFPYSAHLVLKLPYGADVTAANVIVMLEKLFGHLYATQATSPESRINALIRGALSPEDL